LVDWKSMDRGGNAIFPDGRESWAGEPKQVERDHGRIAPGGKSLPTPIGRLLWADADRSDGRVLGREYLRDTDRFSDQRFGLSSTPHEFLSLPGALLMGDFR
jgi:hypothetical protein